MSDLVAHLHVKFCTINALLKHYVLIESRQCFNSVSVKCLGPFFFPYGSFLTVLEQTSIEMHASRSALNDIRILIVMPKLSVVKLKLFYSGTETSCRLEIFNV